MYHVTTARWCGYVLQLSESVGALEAPQWGSVLEAQVWPH